MLTALILFNAFFACFAIACTAVYGVRGARYRILSAALFALACDLGYILYADNDVARNEKIVLAVSCGTWVFAVLATAGKRTRNAIVDGFGED